MFYNPQKNGKIIIIDKFYEFIDNFKKEYYKNIDLNTQIHINVIFFLSFTNW